MLTASEKISCDNIGEYMFAGELSLDGTLLPVKGVLPMAVKARELGFRRLVVPEANVTEAAVVNRLGVWRKESRGGDTAAQGESELKPVRVNTRELFAAGVCGFDLDFSEVKGQDNVKRAFEVALCRRPQSAYGGASRCREVNDGQAYSVDIAASRHGRGA